MEDDGDVEEEEDDVDDDEWDGGENINMLLDGGLHDGGQDAAQQDVQQQQQIAQQMQQQVAQQMSQVDEDNDLNLALYIADEDVGEDERTRKLRDWFRPW